MLITQSYFQRYMKKDEIPIEELLNTIVNKLNSSHRTIATAESCTGGLISHTFTNISGSSDFFERGIISYSNIAKMQLLDVNKKDLGTYGAVSSKVAKEMAEGIRKNADVDIGLSTTGIAGPTGGTKEKPVGLIYIALSSKDDIIVKEFKFKGSRLENKQSTLYQIILLLHDYLIKTS